MTEITFQQTSPRGTATIDSKRVVIDTDGKAWICDLKTPLSDEHVAALQAHFGTTWSDAVAAMQALADG